MTTPQYSMNTHTVGTKDLFKTAWRNVGAKGLWSPPFSDLVTRYSEPHRHYHTMAHVGKCMLYLSFATITTAPDAVHDGRFDRLILATAWHDAVYDPHAADNEEKSAAIAATSLRQAKASDACIDDIARLIVATKHTSKPKTQDECIIVDIDLAIFGSGNDEYDQYERNIRKEYEWVDRQTYCAKRAALLQNFLVQAPIFLTPGMEALEKQALKNLNRAIDKLERQELF